MTTTSPQHKKAQIRLADLLQKYYDYVTIEAFKPTPNPQYIYSSTHKSNNDFTIKPYLLDVYALYPKYREDSQWVKIGIEVDGSKGHKKTKAQTNRDIQRTQNLLCHFPDIKIFRFDTKDLVGRGYVNPKTKKRHSILTDDEILKEIGVKCPLHV